MDNNPKITPAEIRIVVEVFEPVTGTGMGVPVGDPVPKGEPVGLGVGLGVAVA